MYIVFEWLDWSWKDTQLKKVFEYLTDKNKYLQIIKTQEPSWISQAWIEIWRKLKKEWFSSPEEALNLYIQDRVEMNEFKYYNSNNWIVLCSRWDYTTYAYQSLTQWKNKGFSFDEIYNRHREIEWNQNLLIPDITFYFDLPMEVTIERINSRLKDWDKKDFFEKENFLEKARLQYLKAIDYLKEKEGRSIFIINANKNKEDVFNDVKNILDKYI